MMNGAGLPAGQGMIISLAGLQSIYQIYGRGASSLTVNLSNLRPRSLKLPMHWANKRRSMNTSVLMFHVTELQSIRNTNEQLCFHNTVESYWYIQRQLFVCLEIMALFHGWYGYLGSGTLV